MRCVRHGDRVPRLYFPVVSSEFLDHADLPTVHHVTEEPLTTDTDVESSTRLQLVVGEYAVDGQFLGYRSVLHGHIQLCPGPDSSLDAAYDIGVDYRQQVNYESTVDSTLRPAVPHSAELDTEDSSCLMSNWYFNLANLLET